MQADDPLIAFVGDVVPTSQFLVDIGGQGPIVANLEAPITSAARPAIGKTVLKATQNWLVPGFQGRLRVACLANNHLLDYGLDGFLDTTQVLDSAGIAWFGAGRDFQGVQNGVVVELSGMRVGFCGYVCPTTHPVFATTDSPGVLPPSPVLIERDLIRARTSGAERVVVTMHWGAEEVPCPRPEDIQLARTIVALGADLVVGHHAHCVQPFEIIAGVPVFYGLGNAIMPDLDVESDFDEWGVSHRHFRKRQRRWNRQSVLARYSLRAGAAHAAKLRWDGRSLREVPGHIAPNPMSHDSPQRQARRFQRARFGGVLRDLIHGFLEEPKAPRLSHLRALLGKS